MRVLVITQYFWPEEFRVNDLVLGLRERGHEVTVLTGMPNYPKGRLVEGYGLKGPYTEDYGGARVIRAPLITRGDSRGLRLALNYLSFAVSATFVGMARCREHYDAILVFQASPVTVGVPARILSWLTRAPILFWVQDLWPESLTATNALRNRGVLAAVRVLVKWIYRGCNVVLAQSRAFYASLTEMGVPLSRIVYFPNTAEEFYRPVARDSSWYGPQLPEGFKVMFAGNLGAAQALNVVLDAAELLRDELAIQWIIVGDGRQKQWMENEIANRKLGRTVHMMGRHPVQEMPSWFAQADVMLASLGRDPIFALTIPAKIQSYLACGKPIIAAIDGEGARVVTEANAGVGVASEDPVALAAAVLSMSQRSPEELRRMGENGLSYFNAQFERGLLLDKLEGLLVACSGERS